MTKTPKSEYEDYLKRRFSNLTAEDFVTRKAQALIRFNACREFDIRKNHYFRCYSEIADSQYAIGPREFYVYTCVIEAMNICASALGWCDSIIDLYSPAARTPGDLLVQAVADSVHFQQQLAERKLFEILVQTRLFSETNESGYYEHILLLFELDQYLRRQQDSTTFFGKENTYCEGQIAELKAKIAALETRDARLRSAWYLSKEAKKNGAHKLGIKSKIFTSTSQMFQAALKLADRELRMLIGTTYEEIFGSASKWVHFSPSQTYASGRIDAHKIDAHFARIEIFVDQILLHCMELLCIAPGELCQALKKRPKRDGAYFDDPIYGVGEKKFDVGDYVTLANILGKVLDSHKSAFDLVSYLYKPLAGKSNVEEWIPASSPHLALFMRKSKGLDDKMALEKWKAVDTGNAHPRVHFLF